nr:hypothetical protein SEVIR_6G111850v2 [Setaria viridis]
MSKKKCFTKFGRSVDWSDIKEAKQAVKLIAEWETIDVADALELLSPEFEREEIRAYAVRILERADDEELQCYLLQLVQALRFERSDMSHLALFLIDRTSSNIGIASFLRWYVAVERHDPTFGKQYNNIYKMLENSMTKFVGREDGGDNGAQLWHSLSLQDKLVVELCSVMKNVRDVHGSAQNKIEKLRKLLPGIFSEVTKPTRSPLALAVIITGVVPQESSIFKSALHPLCITFKTEVGGTSKIIFKKGDDLWQDQLVI